MSSIELKDFGQRIKRLRSGAGLTGDALAQRLNRSQSFVAKIENGYFCPTVEDLHSIAEALRLDGQDRQDFLDIGLLVAREENRLTSSDSERTLVSQKIISLRMAKARSIDSYTVSYIPGLLQSPEYTKCLLRSLQKNWDEETLATVLRLRTDRVREFLARGIPSHFLIEEFALRIAPGGKVVQSGQARLLLSYLENRNIKLGVLPLDRTARALCPTGFTIYDRMFAFVETQFNNHCSWLTNEIQQFYERFELISEEGVYGDDAKRLLNSFVSN